MEHRLEQAQNDVRSDEAMSDLDLRKTLCGCRVYSIGDVKRNAWTSDLNVRTRRTLYLDIAVDDALRVDVRDSIQKLTEQPESLVQIHLA